MSVSDRQKRYRELDKVLGLTSIMGSEFYDNRKGKNIQHNSAALQKIMPQKYL
jgi:hypothetical protein